MSFHWFVTVAMMGYALGGSPVGDGTRLKLSECPEAVRKSIEAEAAGAKIDVVTREKEEDDEAIFWAEVFIDGKTYALGVLEDGTLSEMSLSTGADETVPIERTPAATRSTFQSEAFGQKIATVVKDLKYGVTIFEAVVEHRGKSYEIVVADDGTLVEKVLVIDDEDIDLAACPAPVQATFKKHARGGMIEAITRSAGIGKPVYEAEIEIGTKVYLIEVDQAGLLVSKSLQAGQE